ncbi:MAG: hypothetical protein EB078_06710 [Proteobacteria bacterium]|nr:hypothetical protein [Pseudomonadota bacterium]NDC23501.1 hypothetical protein [Pseudomonadota bacterium]NDD04579.1 hypothetical protein [Pseudomonadota bacterium]NDG28300.1 hypothetical protein [Pseudomonadota bacterium]
MKITGIGMLCLIFANVSFGEFGCYFDKKEKEVAEKALPQIEKDVQTLEGFAKYSNAAIGAIVEKSVNSLRHKGSRRLATELEQGWAQLDGQLILLAQSRQVLGIRSIGDFEPLNQWLSESYEKIEADLGYDFCFSQRISDMKTINHGLVVVFNPCEYGYDEFYKHFASDDPKYRSVLPVVSYWATVLGCYAGSYGSGYIMVCGAAGTMVESTVDEKFAPLLAPKIYESNCQK